MKIISEELIPNIKAKELLEKVEKERELKYEQKNALDILKKFPTPPLEKVERLIEELRGIERLRDNHIINIVNFLPEDKEELRVVLHKDFTSFTPEEIDKILEIIKRNI
ncbi:MAG: RNA polymerase Rpb4 family protein [Candidatus Heimdallarchaeota archaeon]